MPEDRRPASAPLQGRGERATRPHRARLTTNDHDLRQGLQSDSGNATDIPVLGDEWLVVNMSVWRDSNALTDFMYQGQHREPLSRGREWCERLAEAVTALWWVPAGHHPTVAEAEERLPHLRAHGPTPYAFTLRTTFPAIPAKPVVPDAAALS